MARSAGQFADPRARGAGDLIDPAALMRMDPLELRARVVVEGFWHGIHRSPYHGFSTEFTEYRQYSPGDDTRYLDWRVLARTDRAYIKKFEDETNLRCHLIVDHSRSMDYGSQPFTKSQYAGTLAATLGYFLYTQGDAVGLVTFGEKVNHFIPARNRPGHLRQIMLTLDQPAAGRGTSLIRPLRHVSDMIRKRGMLVILSDMLAPLDELETHLAYLRAAGHDVVIFHLLDPAERDFGFADAMLFEDVESGKRLYIDPAQARDGYLQRLNEHLDQLRQICDRLGVDLHTMATDRPMELALFDFMTDRSRRGREIRRTSSAGGGR